MAHCTLGIDISDELLSAVVVSGKGRDAQVLACGHLGLEEHAEVQDLLPPLLEQLDWQGGRCVSGLSLSCFSLRNLFLPFTQEKKIQQILPFELEEHLLTPVDQQIFTNVSTGESEAGTSLLAAAIEKQRLLQHLTDLEAAGLDPEKVCPASFVLADYLSTSGADGRDFMLLYGDMGSMTLAICHQQQIVFMRRLSYPEKVFTDALFTFDGRAVRVADQGVAEEAVSTLCGFVQRSRDYFAYSGDVDVQADHVIVAGPMQMAPGFQKQIEQELGLPCRACNLVQSGSARLSSHAAENWLPAIYDRPLALALQVDSKKISFNFRRDEFARKGHLLGSKKQTLAFALAAGVLVVLLFGYLIVDYQSLKNRHDTLADSMEQVFTKSFPKVTRIVDPLMQMRAKLQEMQAPTVSMPLFTQEKRILAIVADISARIPAALTLHVSRLVIDQDSVKIKGTTDAFNNVNTIKKALAESDRYRDVSIVSAAKAKDKNVIRFEIKLELGESS